MMHFLEEFWDFLIRHQRDLPALMTGALSGVFLSMIAARIYNGSKKVAIRIENIKLRGSLQQQDQTIAGQLREIERLGKDRDFWHEKAGNLIGANETKAALIEALTVDNERLKEGRITLGRRFKKLRRRLVNSIAEVEELTGRLDTMDKSDGRIWNKPVLPGVTPFRPLVLRHTPIVSVVNLKGGVGKTTITANLGATFASLGRRVLLVDLDHQGSLTTRCIGRTDDYTDARKARRLIEDVLREGDAGLEGFHRSAIRMRGVDGAPMFVLGADDKFADVEMRLMERWLSRSTGDDVRYRLRRVLHDPSVSDLFDIILLDCPPRLTTGCVNALTSSDYVLIPVLPEDGSTDAVPRLLGWLKSFGRSSAPTSRFSASSVTRRNSSGERSSPGSRRSSGR